MPRLDRRLDPRLDPEIRTAINGYLRTHHIDLCRHWFDEIEPLDITGGVLRLLVREPVQLRYLQRACTPQFTEAAQAVTGRLLAVRFVGPDEADAVRSDAEPHAPSPMSVPLVDRAEPPMSPAGERAIDATTGAGAAIHGASAEGRPQQVVSDAAWAQTGVNGGFHGGFTGSRTAWANGSGPETPRASELPALDEQTLLSPDYSFDNFVVGPGNRLAHAAAMAVAEKPGRAYNPYFIHGGVGLGKTHLLQAICQTLLRRAPQARICYISCNTFMDLFHEGVRAGRMLDFRTRFRTVDLLVIDDIHFLSKHEQTQEEFFHTFNALYQAGKQIVLSSDAAPSEIPDLEERLTSRFSCGLVARIERPDYESRVAIVKAKARMHDLDIPDDVPAYIAAKFDSNIRELEGALTKIRGLAMALKLPINLDLAKQALADVAPSATTGQPSVQLIIEEVSRFFDVKLTDLLSKRRHKSIALPRQVCMWLARKHTRYSLEEIGGYFGGRDHTTVMHAIKTINSKTGGDAKLSADVSRLEQQLLQRLQ